MLTLAPWGTEGIRVIMRVTYLYYLRLRKSLLGLGMVREHMTKAQLHQRVTMMSR